MEETGTICQPPIIELVTKYHEKATLREFCAVEEVSQELNDFVNTGLFIIGTFFVFGGAFGHSINFQYLAFIFTFLIGFNFFIELLILFMN